MKCERILVLCPIFLFLIIVSSFTYLRIRFVQNLLKEAKTKNMNAVFYGNGYGKYMLNKESGKVEFVFMKELPNDVE